MTFQDVHMLVAIKLLFLVFLIGGLLCIKKKARPWVFLVFFGLLSATSYMLLVNDRGLLFWGLLGDEITIAAMYNTFAHAGLGSDFAFHHLPAFYPPGYFWLFAIPGKWLGWNGVHMAKAGAATFFLFFPISTYLLHTYLAKKETRRNTINTVFAFLTPLIVMSTLGIDLLIGKPYEVVAGVAMVLWTIALHKRATKKTLSWKEVLAFGVVAGVTFIMYYLWLVFAGMVYIIQMFIIERKKLLLYIQNLAKVAVVGIIVALPFIAPLLHAYITIGMENWQVAFYTPVSSHLWLPVTQFGTSKHIVLFAGLLTILWYYKETIPRILLSFLGAAFIWWGFGLSLLLFFSRPFQEFRGFYVLGPIVLSLGAAYGAAKLWQYLREQKHAHAQRVIAFLGILLLGAHAIFGFFVDDPVVQKQWETSKSVDSDVTALVDALKQTPDASTLTTLHTVPHLPAFFPINHYLYFNQHNTHPAAIFTKRYASLTALSNATSPEEAYELASDAEYGPIDQFIFTPVDENTYALYFELDKPIVGIEGKRIDFPKSLFSDEYFTQVHESGRFVVLRRNQQVATKEDSTP